MKTSNIVHSFLLTEQEGNIILTTKEYPWSVLQIIPTTPADFDRTVTALKKRGMVANHDTDRTFCIIHLASGDQDGQHPERHIAVTQDNHLQIIEDLKDTMAQAAVWYKTVDKCAKIKIRIKYKFMRHLFCSIKNSNYLCIRKFKQIISKNWGQQYNFCTYIMNKNKYSVYYNRNVESCQVAEFDTMEEAVAYCERETAGYTEVGPNDNCYEGRGNNFAYEVYEGDSIILDEDGDIAEEKDCVFRTKQYYC